MGCVHPGDGELLEGLSSGALNNRIGEILVEKPRLNHHAERVEVVFKQNIEVVRGLLLQIWISQDTKGGVGVLSTVTAWAIFCGSGRDIPRL